MVLLLTQNVIGLLICSNRVELVSKLESNLQDTVGRFKKWLVDVNAGKIHLASSDCVNISDCIDVKSDDYSFY